LLLFELQDYLMPAIEPPNRPMACECGEEEQTVDHVVLQCSTHRPPHRLHQLTVVDD